LATTWSTGATSAEYSSFPPASVQVSILTSLAAPLVNQAAHQSFKKGEPCVIINVTVPNDYSAQNPNPQFPNSPNPAWAWVFLTAKIFSGNHEINATDLTQVGQPPDSWSYASLNGAETATVSIYLATTSKSEITSFQIVPVWIGGIPLA